MILLSKIRLNTSLSIIFKRAVFGQIFQIIAIPILTRYFTQQDYGVFSYFMTLNLLLFTFITGKYELSILIVEKSKLKNAVIATFFLALSVFTILMVLTFFDPLVLFAKKWIPYDILLLAICTSFFLGLNALFNEYFLRRRFIKLFSDFKMYNAFIVAFFSILFGYYNIKNGLVYGFVIGSVVVLIGQLVVLIRLGFFIKVDLNFSTFINFYKNYVKFPIFYTPSQILNSIVGFIPVFFISSLCGLKYLGLFFMADRLGSIFTNTFGTALRDHFRSQAVVKMTDGSLFNFHLKYSLALLLLVSIIIAFFYFSSFFLLPYFFGGQWGDLGSVFRILLLYFFFQFVNMPTSSVFVLLEAQKADFIWQLFYLATTFLSFYFFSVGDDFETIILVFSLCRAVTYIIQNLISLYLSFQSDRLVHPA